MREVRMSCPFGCSPFGCGRRVDDDLRLVNQAVAQAVVLASSVVTAVSPAAAVAQAPPAFAATLTAMVRKLAPKIDGPALVWGIVILLSVIGNVLTALLSPYTAVTIVWAVGVGLVGGIMACGTVQVAQDTASKVTVRNAIISVTPSSPLLRDTPEN